MNSLDHIWKGFKNKELKNTFQIWFKIHLIQKSSLKLNLKKIEKKI